MVKNIFKDQMLLGKMLSGIPYLYGYTAINILLYSSLNSRLITFMNVIAAIITIFINKFWRDRNGNMLTKRTFIPLVIIETIGYGLLVLYYLETRNMNVFFVLNNIMSIIITYNICNGVGYIKAKRYPEDARGDFDIDLSTIGSINTIVGYGMATLIPPSVEVAFIAFFLAVVIDNGCQVNVFRATYKKGGINCGYERKVETIEKD